VTSLISSIAPGDGYANAVNVAFETMMMKLMRGVLVVPDKLEPLTQRHIMRVCVLA